ncbi:MAG TPA: HAMP domain-containing sensor histidine kinase [Candidatus Nanoarchaeia archaeon]|nr:HAMP domain-containing sensor histidine kinase [Candidatus Nanoarchaeia archaeon]
MFKSATFRLTAWYLAIIMAISLFFSFTVYNGASRSLEEGLRRQVRVFQIPRLQLDTGIPGLEQIYNDQLNEGRRRILLDLVRTNLLIIVLGGLGSYWLARRTLEPIEEALEAQSRFTADASHELRTPLTAMQTEIEVALRDGKLKMPEAKQLLHSNLEEIAKLRALSEGLLALSRHQNGEAVPFEEVSLGAVIEEARLRLEPIIQSTGGKLNIGGDDQVVVGERDSLVSLLVILIDNAIKYSKTSPDITISLERQVRSVLVKVADKGIGIKASDLPYIFNRFYRADSSRSKSTDGYGLGLSIAKQIVDMHSGHIEATSVIAKGTTLIVKLPFKQPKKSPLV